MGPDSDRAEPWGPNGGGERVRARDPVGMRESGCAVKVPPGLFDTVFVHPKRVKDGERLYSAGGTQFILLPGTPSRAAKAHLSNGKQPGESQTLNVGTN